MKTILGALLVIVQIALVARSLAEDDQASSFGPGWYEVEAAHTSLQEWRERSRLNRSAANDAQPPVAKSLEASTYVELEQLARGLKYDPIEILNHLINNYDYDPYWGYVKGPLQTFLEESGNDLDLAALAVRLLEISQQKNSKISNALIVEGEATLDIETLSAWLGCESYPSVLDYTLDKGRIPYNKSGDSYTLARYWVRLTYEGATVQFDPGAISYNLMAPIDLSAATGFVLAEAESQAAGTTTENSATNLKKGDLVGYMENTVGKLRSFLKVNHENDHFADILGEERATKQIYEELILPEEVAYSESHSFSIDDVPSVLRGTLTIQIGDLSYTVNLDAISAKSLVLAFGDNNENEPGTEGDFGKVSQYSQSSVKFFRLTGEVGSLLGGGRVVAEVEEDGGFAVKDNVDSPDSYYRRAFDIQDEGDFEIPYIMRTDLPTGLYHGEIKFTILHSSGALFRTITQQLQGEIVAGHAKLYLDGDLGASESSDSDFNNELRITIKHPAFQKEQVITQPISRGGNYSIISAFGGNDTDKRMMFSLNKYEGLEEISNGTEHPSVSGASMDVVGQHWFKTSRQFSRLFELIADTRKLYFHRVGIVGNTPNGYFIDVAGQFSATIPRTAQTLSNIDRVQFVGTYSESALEHQTLQQLQGYNDAISTTKIFDVGNATGEIFYKIDQENFEQISPLISGYDINSIQDIVDTGEIVVLPQSAEIILDEWSGFGYFVFGSTRAGAMIDGGLNGGVSVNSRVFIPGLVPQELYHDVTPDYSIPETLSAEPVDLATGSYYSAHTDLKIGNQEAPLGITFSRRYDSGRADQKGVLGSGWTHNWESVVETFSDENAALGMRRAEDAATAIVAAHAILEIEKLDVQSAKHWLMKALIANWAVDSITHNARSVIVSGEQLVFIKQPGDGYSAPPGVTANLHDMSDGYELRERSKSVLRFRAISDGFRLSEWEDIHGNLLTVSYEDDRVISISDTFGRILNLEYSGDLLTGIRDEFGRSAQFGFADDNLISYTTPNGYQYAFTYDDQSRILTWVNPDGETIAENVYSELGQVIMQFSEGKLERQWDFLYAGNRTIERDPTGAERTYLFNDKDLQVGFVDALGNESSAIFNAHNKSVITVDPNGNRSTFVYDNDINLLERRVHHDSVFDSVTTSYDDFHLPITQTDPNGNTINISYDGNLQPTVVLDALGNSVVTTYNENGTRASVMDQAGEVTSFNQYDEFQNVTAITYSDGSVEQFDYSELGDLEFFTDRRGNVWQYTHDNNRNRLSETRPDGAIIRWAYNHGDEVASAIDAKGNVTTYSHNPLNKLESVSNALNHTSVIGYDLRDEEILTTTPLGHSSATLRDAARRGIGTVNPLGEIDQSTLDPNGNVIIAENALGERIQNQYDYRDLLSDTINPRNETVSFETDRAGNQTSLTNGRGGTFTTEFDELHRAISRTTPEGRTTTTGYTARGKVKSITEPSGDHTDYSYDKVGLLAESQDILGIRTIDRDANGNILSITEGERKVSYAWDILNRITSYTDENGNAFHYEYDGNSNLIVLVYPGGERVEYTYTALNQLETITDWKGNVTTLYWDADGRHTEVRLPNGTVRKYFYDAASQLLEIRDTDAGGFLIYREINAYDAAGKILETSTVPPGASNWQIQPQSNTYNLDNELTSFNGQSVTSDPDGNLLYGPLSQAHGFANFDFDTRNRLLSVGEFSFTYSIAGERNAIRKDGQETRLIVDPNSTLSRVLIRESPTGTKTFYIYGLGLLYELDGVGNIHTYHYDSRGSTTAITAGDGRTVMARWEYSPFGSIVSHEGEFDTLFKYNGRFGVQTDESGLLYLRARYYNSYLRRFINPDPIGFGGGLNWFAYANGNPISLIDPFGLGPIRPEASNDRINGFLLGFADLYGMGESFNNGQTYMDSGIVNDFDAYKWGVIAGVVSHVVGFPVKSSIHIGSGLLRGGRVVFDDFGRLFASDTINPMTVRFSQSSIRNSFSSGGYIDDLAAGLRSGAVKAADVPAIRLIEKDRQLFTLDNRRLEAFRRAEIQIRYRMSTPEEAAAEAWKFTTRNGGTSIRVRGE